MGPPGNGAPFLYVINLKIMIFIFSASLRCLIIAVPIALALFVLGPTPVHAAKLADNQIQAVIDLLVSFRTDEASVASVRNTLQQATVQEAPAVLTPPKTMTLLAGTTYIWRVVATGTAPLSYQWQKKSASGEWSNLPAAIGSQFGINAINASHAGTYRVRVSNALGTTYSPEFSLALSAPGINLLLNGDFLYGAISGGQTTSNVGVYFADHWYGGPGDGATAHYEIKQDPAAAVPRYLRVVWSAAPLSGEVQHLPAFRFTFAENSILVGNLDNDVRQFYGKTVELSFWARVSSGSIQMIPIAWQSWDISTPGVAGIKGAGYEVFEPSGVPGTVAVALGAPNPAGVVQVTTEWRKFSKRIAIPNNTGKLLTNGAYTGFGFDFAQSYVPTIDVAQVEVRIVDEGVAPSISAHPQSVVQQAGATYVWSVTATGTPTLAYQWQKKNASGGWDNIPAAGGRQFGISAIQASHAGEYRVQVSNALGTVYSNVFTLGVSVPVPIILSAPQSIALSGGSTHVFSVSATGTPPLAYAWQKKDASGSWQSIPMAGHWLFGISNINASHAGEYRVAVSNGGGTTYSNPFTISVNLSSADTLLGAVARALLVPGN
jgi:hypothetical protein